MWNKLSNYCKSLLIVSVFVVVNITNAQTYTLQQLDSLPFISSTSASNAVVKLNLRKQKLKQIPAYVYDYKNLQYLDLGKNKIKQIDSIISQCTSLQVLNLSKNQLNTLPESIGDLKKLKRLIISENNITELPNSIGGCESLEFIDMWSNNTTDLPNSLNELKKLKTIDMRVIGMNLNQQNALKEKFPNIKFYFSYACNCGN